MESESSLASLQEPTTVILSNFKPVPIVTIGKCPFIKYSRTSLRGVWGETNTRGDVIVLSFDTVDA